MRSAVTQASLSRVHSGGQRTGPAEQRGSVEQPRAEGSAGEGTLREKGTPHSVGRPARKCSGIESLLKAAEASGRGAKRRTGPPGGRPPQPPSRAHGSPLSLPEPQASPLVGAPHPLKGQGSDSASYSLGVSVGLSPSQAVVLLPGPLWRPSHRSCLSAQ